MSQQPNLDGLKLPVGQSLTPTSTGAHTPALLDTPGSDVSLVSATATPTAIHRVKNQPGYTTPTFKGKSAQKARVTELVAAKGFIPRELVKLEVAWFYDSLGIDDTYFENESVDVIGDHVLALFGAKVKSLLPVSLLIGRQTSAGFKESSVVCPASLALHSISLVVRDADVALSNLGSRLHQTRPRAIHARTRAHHQARRREWASRRCILHPHFSTRCQFYARSWRYMRKTVRDSILYTSQTRVSNYNPCLHFIYIPFI